MEANWKRWLWGAGREGRRAYGAGWLTLIASGWALHAVPAAIVASDPRLAAFFALPLLLAEFAIAWLSVFLVSRRLHDLGRSGWWQVIPTAIAVAAALAEPGWATALGWDESGSATASLIGVAVYGTFLIGVGVLRGSPRPNRFGWPP